MKRVFLQLALIVGASTTVLAAEHMKVFDFSEEDAVGQWLSVNDVVMGGVSSGRLEAASEGTAVFTGNVSLENNGGFASVRSVPRVWDLGRFSGVVLRLRGDGQRYKLNLKTDSRLDGVLYRGVFESRRDEWHTVRLRFEDFVPTFRGRRVPDAEVLDPARIRSFGLMISDGQAGPFRLELATIEAFED